MQNGKSVKKMILDLSEDDSPPKKSLFVAEHIPGVKIIDILSEAFVPPMGVPSNILSKLRTTENLNDAAFALIPHEWVHIKKNTKYVEYINSLSRKTPIVVFNTGDVSPQVHISRCLEIRTFIHPWEGTKNKIIVPYPAKAREWKPREWQHAPRISFMGQVPRLSRASLFSFSWRSIFHIIDSSVYIQRKVSFVRAGRLKRVFEVEAVRRESFTAYKKNPNLEKFSLEFQESLNNSDYILCPRGFGNTSIRFYEALSAGRIPLLIRSGNELPNLNHGSKWDEHILEIDLFGNWEKSISEHWRKLSLSSDYLRRQEMNAALFSTQLNYKRYLENIFQEYLIPAKSS